MITFSAPECLMLLPLGLVVARWVPSLELWRWRRAVLAVLMVLLAADPSWQQRSRAMDLHVLLDRSASTDDWVDQGLPEWREVLEHARSASAGQLRWWNFSDDITEELGEGESSRQRGQSTRLSLALQHVAALASPDRQTRLLVMTDGYATESLDQAVGALRQRGIAVDFRLRADGGGDDARIADFSAPMKVQHGEPVALEIEVRARADGKKPLRLWRDDQLLGEAAVQVQQGVGRLQLADRLTQAGVHRYAVELVEADAHPGNNRLERWVEVQGGAAVLWLTRYQPDPALQALRERQVPVQEVRDGLTLTAASLAGVRAVVFNDVPAHLVAPEFLRALPFFVEEQGGGLMMLGGEHSFGAGGYFESPIDALLPVSMELKVEHRKLMVAMAVVLDRSGSMAAEVTPGLTKMDLADEGVASLIGLLGQSDQVAVDAVDTAAEAIVPLTQVGAAQQALMARVRRIRSAGGGILVEEGLKAGWKALQQSTWGTRHMIFFADAADAEQPGRYRELLEQMTDQGVTVSVIGLGSRGDKDAALLEEIAELGNGRAYFCENAKDLPQLFAQEAVTVARSAFLKQAVTMKETGRWREIADGAMTWPAQWDGYNLSYTREGSTVSLLSGDEYAAPLIATARRGLGRSVAVAFPLAGDFSASARAWPQHGDLVLTLTRWMLGSELPPGLSLVEQVVGTELKVDLRYDPELWQSALMQGAPRLRVVGGDERVREFPWQRMAPGHYQLRAEMAEGDAWRGVVQWSGYSWPFGPILAGKGREWSFDARSLLELRQLAQATGGMELRDLSQAWRGAPQLQRRSWRPFLLWCGLGFLLWDAAATRLGRAAPRVEWTGALARDRVRSAAQQVVPWLRKRWRKRAEPTVERQHRAAHLGRIKLDQVELRHETEQRQSRFRRAKQGGTEE